MKQQHKTYVRIIAAVLVLYLFLVSIKLMGSGFKSLGKGFAESLLVLGTVPLCGLIVGILGTSVAQSSSLTTSLIVTLVAADTLSLRAAIPMIMGANIGTSVTNSIVSLGHVKDKTEFRRAVAAATVHDFFNFIAVAILFPLEWAFHILEKSAMYLAETVFIGSGSLSLGGMLNTVLNPAKNFLAALLGKNPIAMIIVALVLLFAALRLFVGIVRPLVQTEFNHIVSEKIFKHPFQSFLVGIGLTIFAQSSSITTSLAVPLVGVGMLSVRKIFPYTVGANIGTTLTALLAALASDSQVALIVALTHVLFNVFSASIIMPFYKIPLKMAYWMGDMSVRSRLVPFAYVGSAFFILPLLALFLWY